LNQLVIDPASLENAAVGAIELPGTVNVILREQSYELFVIGEVECPLPLLIIIIELPLVLDPVPI
jgi:hypothetical protein